MSRIDTGGPPLAMNRSFAARGSVIARRCRSATSRTSTTPNQRFGQAGGDPSRSRLTSPSDEIWPGSRAGPKMPVGLTVVSSRPAPSAAMKSQAARSARALDFT